MWKGIVSFSAPASAVRAISCQVMGFVFRDDRGDENGPPSVDGRGFQAVAFDDPLQDAQQGRALLRRQGVEEFGIIGIGECRQLRSEEHTSELQSLMRTSSA